MSPVEDPSEDKGRAKERDPAGELAADVVGGRRLISLAGENYRIRQPGPPPIRPFSVVMRVTAGYVRVYGRITAGGLQLTRSLWDYFPPHIKHHDMVSLLRTFH
jgi:hypothetical protein